MSFEGWAILEIMGHQSHAGYVKSEVLFGTEMLRIDVPEIPEEKLTEERYGRQGRGTYEILYPAIPAYTKYYGGASIYSLTPCSEAVARAAATSMRKTPVTVVSLPEIDTQPRALLLASDISEDEPKEGMDPFSEE